MSDHSDKIMKARCRLMICEPFYGHISINIDWIPHEMPWKPVQKRSMGVRIVNGGQVQCLYFPPFVDRLTLEELYGVIQHEIEHIVRCHCIRIGDRDGQLWNVATDMSVNGKRHNPRIGYKDNRGNVTLPLNGEIIWIPDDWDSDLTTESYYDLLDQEQLSCSDFSNQIDDHETWSQSEVSADEARQVVKNLINEAVDKSLGRLPDHVQSIIKRLSQPIVKWQQLLRLNVGRHIGNKRHTYSRRDRRSRAFGTKGTSKHAIGEGNVIVDISRSVNEQELEQFFTEIEAISFKCQIWILLWDDQFRGYAKYRRGDWRKIPLNGRGGTDMAAPIEWLYQNRLVKDVQIMLTDGYCEYSSPKNMEYICVVTTNDTNTKLPSWGKVIQMHVTG